MFPKFFSSASASDPRALRKAALKRVAAMRDADRAWASERVSAGLSSLLEERGVASLAAFWPMRSEPDVRPALLAWLRGKPGRELLLPRTTPDGSLELVPVSDPGTQLERSELGVLQPVASLPAAERTPDLVLVPGTVFGRSGERLGRGGGCYDRLLASLPESVPTVGVCFRTQVSRRRVPQEAHDRPVGATLTEEGLVDRSAPKRLFRRPSGRTVLWTALTVLGRLLAVVGECVNHLRVENVTLTTARATTHPDRLPSRSGELSGPFGLEFDCSRLFFDIGRVRIVPDDHFVSLHVDGVPVDLDKIEGSLYDWTDGFVVDIPPGKNGHRRHFAMHVVNHGGIGGVEVYVVRSPLSAGAVLAGFFLFAFSAARLARRGKAFTAIFCSAALVAAYTYLNTRYSLYSYDADAHLEYVRWLLTHRSLPDPDGGWEFHQPPLYYLIGALIVGTAEAFTSFDSTRLLQGFSLLCWAGFVWTGWSFLSLLLPKRRLWRALLFALLAFWPSGFLFAPRVGNDPLFYFLCAQSFLRIALWWKEGRPGQLYKACLFVSLTVVAKSNGLIPLGEVGLLMVLALFRVPRLLPRQFLAAALILCAGLGLSFGDNVAMAVSKGGNALTGSSGRALNSALKVGNGPENYLRFKVRTFLKNPYTSAWSDAYGRHYFLNYAMRSSLTGEFNLGPKRRTEGLVMGWALLVLAAVMLLGMALHPKLLAGRNFLPTALAFFLSLAALAFFRWYAPYSCHNDFRLVYPMVMPAVGLLALHSGDRTGRERLFRVPLALAIAAMVVASASGALSI